MVIMYWSLGLWPRRHWRHSLKYVLGLESRAEWNAKYAAVRGYPVLHEIAPLLGPECRLLIERYQYNLPVEALPYMSTEAELLALHVLPESERIDYLNSNNFAFFYSYHFSQDTPEWLKGVRVFDEYQQSGRLGYRVYWLKHCEKRRNR